MWLASIPQVIRNMSRHELGSQITKLWTTCITEHQQFIPEHDNVTYFYNILL